MTGLRKFKIPSALAVLIFVSILVGCAGEKTGVAPVGQGPTMPPQRQKADLLKELENQFENPEAHFELGRLYHREGLWAQAGYQYEVALSFDPAHRRAQAAMVKVLLDSGDTPKAKDRAETYIRQLNSSTVESLRLGRAFAEQQLDEYTLACYQQALGLSPKSAAANRAIGYYYLDRSNKEQAKEYLSRSFQIDPTQADVAGELGKLGVEVRIPRPVQQETNKTNNAAKPPDTAGQ